MSTPTSAHASTDHDRFAVASLCELFQRTVQDRGDAPALRTPDGEVRATWRTYGEQVEQLAAGLAGVGVRRGDTVALMMGNRPEFHLLDTAVLHLGAAAFSIYTTFAADTIVHLLRNAGVRTVVCAGEHVETVLAAREGTEVELVIALEGADARTMTLAELKAAAVPGFDFEATWRSVGRDDLATLIYTSGTTGPPKGVELTHANIIAELRATAAVLPVHAGDKVPSAFPMAHAAERWASHYQGLAHGLDVTCVPDLKTLPALLPQLRPNIWGSVPRVWEKLHAGLTAAIDADPDEARREVTNWAIGISLEVVRAEQAELRGEGPGPSTELLAERMNADALVLSQLRARLGLDRVRWAVVGSAPTPLHVLEFFAALGVPICEVWGMSELTACATINPPDRARLGTVGPALPGVTLRLADDGEIEVGGEIVTRGYRDEPDKTAEALTPDGWLRTGDIGTLDGDGYLRIVDRKKELIINASGKNMSPANIEAKLKAASPLIGQAVAIGDGRSYVTALLVLDADSTAAYAAQHDVAGDPARLVHDAPLQAELQAAVDRANADLARVEQVKRFAVVPEFWEAGSELLTPTLKLKRKPIGAQYADLIDTLYAAV